MFLYTIRTYRHFLLAKAASLRIVRRDGSKADLTCLDALAWTPASIARDAPHNLLPLDAGLPQLGLARHRGTPPRTAAAPTMARLPAWR